MFPIDGLGEALTLRDTRELLNLTNAILKSVRLKSLGKPSLPTAIWVLSLNRTTVVPRFPSDTVPDS